MRKSRGCRKSTMTQIGYTYEEAGQTYEESNLSYEKAAWQETISGRADIKNVVVQSSQAKGRIKVLNVLQTDSSKARILQVRTQTESSQARIKNTKTSSISGKSKIHNTTIRTVHTLTRIKRLGDAQTESSKARIKVLNNSQTEQTKARILVIVSKTITSKSRIIAKSLTKPVGQIQSFCPPSRISSIIPSGSITSHVSSPVGK